MIGVGEEFPNMSLTGVDLDNSIMNIEMLAPEEWTVMYFYPKDFTFICPTEITAMDKLVEEADVIGVSGDNEFCKIAWKTADGRIRNLKHILAADCGLKLSNKLGIVDPEENVCLRATYIIDPDGVIQHVSVNALDTGRNAEEILRTLQALKSGGLTGCAWQPEDDFVA
tara:strand:+ start:528 stop:1034 length:507 start_codon:yes stop_codon:yes gene_type:complete